MSAIPPFEKFSVHSEEHTAGTRWKKYLARFEVLIQALDLKNKPARKKALLLHYAGEEVFDIFDTFSEEKKGGEDEAGYVTLKKSLADHFEPKRNLDFETVKFRQAKQEPGENVDAFCTRLRQLASTCDFADLPRELKTQILWGCTSSQLKRRALRDEMTLDKLLELARALELSDIQAKAMEQSTSGESVNFVKKSGQKKFSHGRKFPDKQKNSKPLCGSCGYDNCRSKEKCPAKGELCHNCNGYNHFKSVCPRKPKAQKKGKCRVMKVDAPTLRESDEGDSDAEYVFGVGPKSSTPSVDINLHESGEIFPFFIDTGASVNIVDEKTYKKLGCSLVKSHTNIYAYGSDNPLSVLGKFTTKCAYGDASVNAEFFVVSTVDGQKGGNLLSANTAKELKLIQFAFACTPTSPDIVDEYPELLEGMGKMQDVKVKFHVDTDVKPKQQSHRRIPFHMRKRVEDELKRLEQLDIIEKVDGPTPWVSPIVVAPKPKKPDEIRICVDMRMPNQAIKRTRHIMPTLDDILMRLNGATVFSKLDLNSGYHQLELDEDSRNMTTFSTHVGLRRYKRLNFGVTSAAEIFQNHIAEILSDIDGSMNTSDDILVYGQNQDDHDKALRRVFQRLKDKRLTLNRGKCEFNRDSIEFYGFTFGKGGVSPDPKKVDAIRKMAVPQSVKEVRSFLGLTNYVSRFVPNYSDITKPLRDLTKKETQWAWTDVHDSAFQRLKNMLTQTTTMKYFNPRAETEVIVDASPHGVGAILTQRDTDEEENHVVAYASRALTDVESRYSQTEREALAVVWACEHFHLYLFGSHFTVTSDHKPLEGIFNKPTSMTNARIERWNLRLQSYDFTLRYKPGEGNPADFLSRHPVSPAQKVTKHEKTVADEYVSFLIDHDIPKAMTKKEISDATRRDPTLQAVKLAIVTNSWQIPKQSADIDIASFLIFKTIRDELSFCDETDILLRGDKIVIPRSLQTKVIDIAHEGHQGLIKTKKLLREKVWFPYIDRSVESKVKSCLACQATTPVTNTEPLNMSPLPKSPWSELSIDFGGPYPSGESILVVIDDYSRYPEVEIMNTITTKATLPRLDAIFSRHGVPNVVKSDNGTTFTSQYFQNYASFMGFEHRKIEPLWPQANGCVERMMGTLNKTIISSQLEGRNWKQDLYAFLLNYRATPHSTTGISPAEALFSRKIKTRLPQSPSSPSDFDDQIRLQDTEQKRQYKAYADSARHARVPDVQVGDRVLVRQPKVNKFTAPYLPETLTVTARKGSMVTAGNAKRSVTRNSSFFKKVVVPQTPSPKHENRQDDEEVPTTMPTDDPPTPSQEAHLEARPEIHQDAPQTPSVPQGPRRSARTRIPKIPFDI